MKKGNSINETLILLQQDIREFYGVMPHEFTCKRQISESHLTCPICIFFALKIKSLQIYQFIKQVQNLSDLKELKAHLRKQGWNNF